MDTQLPYIFADDVFAWFQEMPPFNDNCNDNDKSNTLILPSDEMYIYPVISDVADDSDVAANSVPSLLDAMEYQWESGADVFDHELPPLIIMIITIVMIVMIIMIVMIVMTVMIVMIIMIIIANWGNKNDDDWY